MSIDVLLIEHNFEISYQVLEFFREKMIINRIHTTGDGIEAIDFIRNEGIFKNSFYCCLVMVDLKVPYCREVLTEIIKDKNLKNLPVIIFTDKNEDDVLKSYSLPQNYFIVAPRDFQKSFEIINSGENNIFSLAINQDLTEKKHSYLM